MNSTLFAPSTRRDFAVRVACCLSGFGVSAAVLGLSSAPAAMPSAVGETISRKEEAIHQEVVFPANRERVYEVLTETDQFHKVVLASAAMKSGMPAGASPTEISREVGGAFSLFGGHIVGRHVELVPGERLVQAWRVVDWNPGRYSIARFELEGHGSGTRLLFDHTGFPSGQARHLADGWNENYWEPMKKFLA
jgi:activator of HSP90 ATPase